MHSNINLEKKLLQIYKLIQLKTSVVFEYHLTIKDEQLYKTYDHKSASLLSP